MHTIRIPISAFVEIVSLTLLGCGQYPVPSVGDSSTIKGPVLCAIAASTQSHVTSCHPAAPGGRYSGLVKRSGLLTSWVKTAPLMQSSPSLTGWSGSPATWSTLPSCVCTIRPHPTEQ